MDTIEPICEPAEAAAKSPCGQLSRYAVRRLESARSQEWRFQNSHGAHWGTCGSRPDGSQTVSLIHAGARDEVILPPAKLRYAFYSKHLPAAGLRAPA